MHGIMEEWMMEVKVDCRTERLVIEMSQMSSMFALLMADESEGERSQKVQRMPQYLFS